MATEGIAPDATGRPKCGDGVTPEEFAAAWKRSMGAALSGLSATPRQRPLAHHYACPIHDDRDCTCGGEIW